jgi:hypothetical protein
MIVWLASYPRSGNTLLRTILLKCFGLTTYSLYDDLTDIGSRAEFSSIVGHASHGLDQQSFHKAAAESDQTYFVKTHDRPPDKAKAIYVVRDGRSTIVSYYHYRKDFSSDETTSLEDIIVGDCMYGSWSDHFEAWAPASRPNTLLLRYEHLVHDAHKAVKVISDFIGRPALSSQPPPFTELKAVDSKFFRRGSDASNIEELEGENSDLFWLLHGQLMSELGYAQAAPSIHAPLALRSKIRHHFAKARQRYAISEGTIQDLRQRLAEVESSRWWRLGKKLRATTKSIMPNA